MINIFIHVWYRQLLTSKVVEQPAVDWAKTQGTISGLFQRLRRLLLSCFRQNQVTPVNIQVATNSQN